MPILEARQLGKRFGEVVALEGLDLAVDAGEVLCLLGANGAGKSTTLGLFLGFLAPTTGLALVDGVVVHEQPEVTRQALGYLPEVVHLYPHLTAVETLRFFRDLAGHPAGTADMSDTLLRAGLEARAHHARVATFSKGMRQKLALAIALQKQARAYLLDEPLSGLDPQAANELVTALRQLAQSGAAVVVVTHDIFRAQQMATRIGIMRQGRLCQLLDARSLDAPQVEALYHQHLRDLP